MSILDGLPKSAEEAKRAGAIAAQLIADTAARSDLDDNARQLLALLEEGLSLADICGITQEERDAMLAQAGRLLQAGDVKGAQDVLLGLVQIEPTDERPIYTLGVTYQIQGKPEVAGKLFAQAIALDASKQDAYARLGECFMASREYESARGCFEAARIDLGRGPPRPDTVQHADRMLAVLDAAQTN